MQLLIKILPLIIFACLCFSKSDAHAQSQYLEDDFGEVEEIDSSATYEMICDLRKMFCGGVAVAVIAFVVLSIGILILKGKITWGYVIVLLTGCIIFAGASEVTRIMVNPPAGIGVVNACRC